MEAKKGESWNLLSPSPLGRPDTQAKFQEVGDLLVTLLNKYYVMYTYLISSIKLYHPYFSIHIRREIHNSFATLQALLFLFKEKIFYLF